MTNNPEIPFAKSVMDYLFRWLALKFLPREDRGLYSPRYELPVAAAPGRPIAPGESAAAHVTAHEKRVFAEQADAPPCHECGAIMVRSGACYKCFNCGATSGCS
jgi:ribonucleoside-diphosphate reductase alpha chain